MTSVRLDQGSPARCRACRGWWSSVEASGVRRPRPGSPSRATRSPSWSGSTGSAARSGSSSGTASAGTPARRRPRCRPSCATCSASPAGRSSASSTWCRSSRCASTASRTARSLAMPSGSRSAQLEAVDAALGAGLGQQWVDHVHVVRRRPGTCCAASTWSGPGPPTTSTRRAPRCCAPARTLHKVVTRTFKDERLREVALLATRMRRARPAQRAGLDGDVGLRRAELRRLDGPGRDGPAGRGDDQAARRAQGRGAARDDRASTCASRAAGSSASTPTRAPSTPTSWSSRSTRAACRCWRRTCSARCRRSRRCVVPPRPVRRRARPAARGGAARRPDAGRAHRTAPPPPAARPGPCSAAAGCPRTSCRAGPARDRRTPSRSRCASTAPRATRSRSWPGRPYGVLWQGRATIDRKLAATPYAGVYGVGAHAAAGAGLPFVGLSAAPSRPSGSVRPSRQTVERRPA